MNSYENRLRRLEAAAAGRDPGRVRRLALQIVSALHVMRLSVPLCGDPERQEALKAGAERARLACELDNPEVLDDEDRRTFENTCRAIRNNRQA